MMSESQILARELRAKFQAGDTSIFEDIKREVDRYPWYHKVEVIPGLLTPGIDWAESLVSRIIAAMQRFDFAGKRVLDIGCRDGAISFAAERMGASEILGIDNDLSEGLINFLIPFRESRVQAIQLNVNELTREKLGKFDIVLFPGVLYHLRYPIWALRRIADVLKGDGILIIEGGFIEGFGDLPVLFCPIGSDSPYEPTSVTFFNDAGITDTLLSLGFSDVRLVETYAYGWIGAKRNRRRWVKEKFPEFFRRWWWRDEFTVSRKIFTCTKRWSLDDRFKGTEPQDILDRYWDAGHHIHTRSPREEST